MTSSDKKQFELYLVRYLPDVVRGEYLTIGAVLVGDNGEVKALRFTHDWRRAQCLFPDNDLEALQAFERLLQRELLVSTNFSEFLRVFNKYVSSGLELSAPKAIRAVDAAEEMKIIAKHYLEFTRPTAESKTSGRNAILHAMEDSFAAAGVLKLMQRRVDMARYTWPADTLKIDFLYTTNDVVRMFQAVAVARQSESAVGLAYRQAKIASGFQRENKSVFITAVVENSLDRAQEQVACGLAALEDGHIRVAPLAEMPSLAETARLELRA